MKRYAVLVLGLLVFAASSCLQAADPPYFPGSTKFTLARYDELGTEFFKAWSSKDKFTPWMEALLAELEPEVLQAAIRLHTEPKIRALISSYSELPVDKHSLADVATADGMLGLRVIKQVEIPEGPNQKPSRLVSWIETHTYDFEKKRIVPRAGPDTVRIRVELEPFSAPKEKWKIARGFVGFSWLTQVSSDGEISRIYSESYVSDRKGDWIDGAHTGIKMLGVTACGFANHCTTCHHRTQRNVFSEKDFAAPQEKSKGAIAFLSALRNSGKVTDADVKNVELALSKPGETFRSESLVRALKKRWEEIRPKQK